jgi:hypothetical protein
MMTGPSNHEWLNVTNLTIGLRVRIPDRSKDGSEIRVGCPLQGQNTCRERV